MKIRVLHVYPQLNCGGTEMVIYNLIKFGNHDKFQYEILVQRSGDNEEAFRALNCKIHTVGFKNKKQYLHSLIEFFQQEKFDVIHLHTHSQIPIVLSAAKKERIIKRVVHSHCARTDLSKGYWLLRFFFNHKYEKNATHLIGCSSRALQWLFPLKWHNGIILQNGIDLSKFQYNKSARIKIRETLKIPNFAKVHIYVGRFAKGKNQEFVLKLAQQRKDSEDHFLLIGDGPELQSIKDLIIERNLDNVMCIGKQDNINEWLSAADDFLFPSKFEGLGIVAIEAQATGLRVIAAEGIPDDADIGIGLFNKFPLYQMNVWLDLMSMEPFSEIERQEYTNRIKSSQYNINNVLNTLESIYAD